MLVTLKEILELAEAKRRAVGAFNTPNLESVMAVLSAARRTGQPVILMHAEIHEPLVPLQMIGPVMLALADRAAVPVCVHLDHGESLDYLRQAMELGFTSVMYDGSALPYEENCANTRIAVGLARRYGVSVEGEIGTLGRREILEDQGTDEQAEAGRYTDPALAGRFVRETGIDALACAFGTAHGLYARAPRLDFERLARIRDSAAVPLVMHGGSGVKPEDYARAIGCGVRKINYYTYMAKAGGEAVRQAKEAVFFHEFVTAGMEAMSRDAEKAISIFSGMGAGTDRPKV